ncbi:MAG TPA: hypothetical protein VF553_14710 [Pyrinomonadaceae bacterium]|jgi:hypothetical protein
MKIRRSTVLITTLATCALALAAACSKGPATNSNGAATAGNANASNSRPAATPAATTPATTASLTTPTNTFMAFYEASKKNDVEAVKRTLSKGSLDFLTGEARKDNKTLEAALTESLKNADVPTTTPEVRNEKIDGDNATLEVKDNKTNSWDTFNFVKENGEWKIKLGLE